MALLPQLTGLIEGVLTIVLEIVPLYTSTSDPKGRSCTAYRLLDGSWYGTDGTVTARAKSKSGFDVAWLMACREQDNNMSEMARRPINIGVETRT